MRIIRSACGKTLIELLVALPIFALMIVLVDAVFINAHRGAKRADLAAEVQHNARMAIERMTREIRESGGRVPDEVRINNGVPGRSAVVFKSARLPADSTVFCLYVRTVTEPLFQPDCFTFPGGNVPAPPYASIGPASPYGSYQPIWQRAVGYYLVATTDGLSELRRAVIRFDRPDQPLPDPLVLTGGDTVAALVEAFDITLSGRVVRLSLKARGGGAGLTRDLVEAIDLSDLVEIRH